MSEPTLHDIARGTTGCGDDDYADDLAFLDRVFPGPFTIELERHEPVDSYNRVHTHDALCYGTGPWGHEYRCGYDG